MQSEVDNNGQRGEDQGEYGENGWHDASRQNSAAENNEYIKIYYTSVNEANRSLEKKCISDKNSRTSTYKNLHIDIRRKNLL